MSQEESHDPTPSEEALDDEWLHLDRSNPLHDMTHHVYAVWAACQNAWIQILYMKNSKRDTSDDREVTLEATYKILRDTGKFTYHYFLRGGYFGEGNYVDIEATMADKTLTITHGMKTQMGDTKPIVKTLVSDECDVLDPGEEYRFFGYKWKNVKAEIKYQKERRARRKEKRERLRKLRLKS